MAIDYQHYTKNILSNELILCKIHMLLVIYDILLMDINFLILW